MVVRKNVWPASNFSQALSKYLNLYMGISSANLILVVGREGGIIGVWKVITVKIAYHKALFYDVDLNKFRNVDTYKKH